MLLKVNPGTQIRVSPPLSRNTEQSHYLIDPPPQKRVIKFVKFGFFFLKIKNFQKCEILKLLKYSIVSRESNDM